jgi:hypothetical protein
MRKWLLGGFVLLFGGLLIHLTALTQSSESKTVVGSSSLAQPVDFTVTVTLSERATKKLIGSKETVIVAAYLSGIAKKGALKKYSHDGEVGLGDINIEVLPGESAKFRNVKPEEKAFEQTDRQSPQVLINVFSGRKSSKNNLISCDIYEGTSESIQQKSIAISCGLIEENPTIQTIK